MLVTLTLPVALGLLALVVDVGWAYWRKEACRTAAQAAAIAVAANSSANISNGCGAGSTNLICQSDTACPSTLGATNPVQAGCLYAQTNGFVNGGQGGRQSVSIAANTTGAPTGSPNYWATVTVSEKIPSLFSMVLGQGWMNVSANATAGVFNGGGGCIYALNGTMDGGINTSNGSLSSNCGIYVDSNDKKAVDTSNGSITTTNGAKTNIVGKCNNDQGCSEISPAPNEGSSVADDPFASFVAPSTAGMTTYTSAINVNGGATITLQPGIYTQLITANNGTLTFTHGTYVLQAGINVNGAHVNDDGLGGELLYVTGGQVKITSGTVTLNAQTTGDYRGMLLFQASTDTNAVIMTDGTLTVSGAVYAKTAQLQITDGSFNNSTIVVDNIRISNGSGGAQINGAANTQFTGLTITFIQ